MTFYQALRVSHVDGKNTFSQPSSSSRSRRPSSVSLRNRSKLSSSFQSRLVLLNNIPLKSFKVETQLSSLGHGKWKVFAIAAIETWITLQVSDVLLLCAHVDCAHCDSKVESFRIIDSMSITLAI